jgi:hypothetical protein
MVFEAEIRIRRDNAKVLADDFQAVTALLEQRKADRDESKTPLSRRHLELVGPRPANA